MKMFLKMCKFAHCIKREDINILIISSIDFPNGMASTSLITLVAKGFAKNGINTQLLIHSKLFNEDSDESNYNREGRYQGFFFKYFNKHGISQKSYDINILKNIVEISKYLKLRKKKGFKDIIITYDNDLLKNLPIFLNCYLNKIPFFPWEVEKRISAIGKKKFKQKINHLSYALSDYILPKIATGYIVISTFLKDYYSTKMNVDKIYINPILVDYENQSKLVSLSSGNEVFKIINSNKNNKIIVYSGSFGEKDGFPYIIKAFKLFQADYPNSIFIATGKPGKYTPMVNILKDVKELGLREKFIYMGLVNKEELKYINQQADLLLVCRSNSEYANHGFPWKLGEYLMTNNPIIATKVGDIEKYFVDGKEIFIAEPENYESIYNLMNKIFKNYNEARLVAESGREKACNVFNYIKLTNSTLCFINAIINK